MMLRRSKYTLVHFDLDNDSPYGIPPSERFFGESDSRRRTLLVIDQNHWEIAIKTMSQVVLSCFIVQRTARLWMLF